MPGFYSPLRDWHWILSRPLSADCSKELDNSFHSLDLKKFSRHDIARRWAGLKNHDSRYFPRRILPRLVSKCPPSLRKTWENSFRAQPAVTATAAPDSPSPLSSRKTQCAKHSATSPEWCCSISLFYWALSRDALRLAVLAGLLQTLDREFIALIWRPFPLHFS